MWSNFSTVSDEMARRHEFVLGGSQTARCIERFVADRSRAYYDRALQAAGDTLIALGTWLRQGRSLNSVHS